MCYNIGMMENIYQVKKCESTNPIRVKVPGSKSITNRALMLAALSSGSCKLSGVLFSDDSRAFLDCLEKLGFTLSVDEENKTVTVKGEKGRIPNAKAEINVRSAGTAARFLTVMLAFAGGEYRLNSSDQMKKRPMEQLITALRQAGVRIECLEEEGHFPFLIKSEGIQTDRMEIDTEISSQFASAILMASVLVKKGLHIVTTGNRTAGAYIKITLEMMKQFGISLTQKGGEYFVAHNDSFCIPEYAVEPDFSAACYFYAAGALLNREVVVEGLRFDSLQGDKKFIGVLEDMGCSVYSDHGEIRLRGAKELKGVCVDMNDFSDQALTLAAIAPFASSLVKIEHIGHIRKQECDRIRAIAHNLRLLGVTVEEGEDYVVVYPCHALRETTVETYHDHRVAMAFAVGGLKEGNVTISNPSCCKKTFENFFDVLESVYE